jgi:hypothetical protein
MIKTTLKTLILFLLFGLPIISFSQNTCADAITISVGTHVVNAVDGTQVPQPICTLTGTNPNANPRGKWYKYVPTQNYNLTITTDIAANTPRVDTRFHVYTGSCSNLVCYDGDDDSGTNYSSVKTFPVLSGTIYYIAFDNRWTSAGFTFQLIESTYVPPITNPVTFTAQNIGTISGTHKICVADLNGDSLDDIVTVSSTSVQIHYQQNSGGFSVTSIPTTAAQFLPTWSMAIGDYDKNGFNDLVYGGGNGVTIMRANNTGTGFTQISGPQYVFSQRSNFVDINNDGHLDIFVCHDVQPNVYYMNDGNGNLTFNQGGIGDHPQGGNYGSLWVDYDNDGDQDLFLAKCRGGSSTAKFNELHRNDGNGVFTNVSVAANLYDPLQTWSSAWNDYDNDGFMDVVVGASSSADGSHKLMKNNGNGTFSNITTGSGWDTNTTLNIEHVTYDFDNDGYADVLGGAGKIMFNNGDFTFFPVTYAFNNGAIGDLNNDGFLDIQNGNTIYYNNGNSNNWIKINLQGIQSNRNGIGARVEIYGNWGKQIRDVRSGEGFRYMNTLNTHFGIGTATAIDEIRILWPSGIIDVIENPNINQAIVVVEGSSPLSLVDIDGEKINVYPNPTSGILNISNLDLIKVKNITIYNQLGQILLENKNSINQIDVSNLSEGLYILTIETNDNKKYSESFIKK